MNIPVNGEYRHKMDALDLPGYNYRDFINAACRADAMLFELLGNSAVMPGAVYDCRNNSGSWFRLARDMDGWAIVDCGEGSTRDGVRCKLILTPRQDEISIVLHRKKYFVEG